MAIVTTVIAICFDYHRMTVCIVLQQLSKPMTIMTIVFAMCVTVQLCCLLTIMYANDRCDCTGSFPPDTVPGQSMDWFYGAYLQSWGYWLPYSVAPTIMR